MDDVIHARVAERAYEIWIAAGCPDGAALDHWLMAEHELCPAEEAAAKPGRRKKAAASEPAEATA